MLSSRATSPFLLACFILLVPMYLVRAIGLTASQLNAQLTAVSCLPLQLRHVQPEVRLFTSNLRLIDENRPATLESAIGLQVDSQREGDK